MSRDDTTALAVAVGVMERPRTWRDVAGDVGVCAGGLVLLWLALILAAPVWA